MMTENAALPRSAAAAPEAQGIASAAVLAFVDAIEKNIRDLHSFMLVRHGTVVAEGWWSPYAPQYPHMLFSLSKSFTATAAGLAAAEGLLSLDDLVLSFFPEDAPETVSAHLAALRVRDLLTMTSGHAEDTLNRLFGRQEGNWAKGFLHQPLEHAPGTHFVYNSGATYMVSAILQKVTGKTLLEFLQPRLFAPLGIVGATWETCPRGINTGGWGLSARTEDIARFGQLYLQKGVWQGERLLPEGWVEEATARQVSNGDNPESDWNQGYGYQFWRSRHGAYRGDGAFGQFCVVMPEQDAVLAITSGAGDMAGTLNLVWEHLLPAFGPSPLPEDADAAARLRARLSGLVLPTPVGARSSSVASGVTGTKYILEPNEQKMTAITLDSDGSVYTFVIEDDRGAHRIACGIGGAWRTGTTAWNASGNRNRGGSGEQGVAASGAWASEDTFTAALCFVETPFCLTATCRFANDGLLQLTVQPNVGFGPMEPSPTITGRADERG